MENIAALDPLLPDAGAVSAEILDIFGEEASPTDSSDHWALDAPGATSARDSYYRQDRFEDVKAKFAARMREGDPTLDVHEPTWQQMTRTPKLKTLLEEVRQGTASLADLEQNYRSLAPDGRAHQATTPREFTRDDKRSQALTQIVRHTAERGSLSERAQWAALGVVNAVTAVQHFREWVLGGQPADLWPDLRVRVLATERWVEEQAQHEPSPDPDYILHYGDGKMRAVAWGGALGALKRCAMELERDFGWREDQAVRFIVTGFMQATPKLTGRMQLGGVYRATARIVMDIDPRTSPDEVCRLYDRWRQTLALPGLLRGYSYPDRDRAMDDKHLALAVFVAENWRPDVEWSELHRMWNEQHPAWLFSDDVKDPDRNFANHARQAWSLVTGENWPKFKRKDSPRRRKGQP